MSHEKIRSDINVVVSEIESMGRDVLKVKNGLSEFLTLLDKVRDDSRNTVAKVQGIEHEIGELLGHLAQWVDSDSETYGRWSQARHETENLITVSAGITALVESVHNVLAGTNESAEAAETVIASAKDQADTTELVIEAAATT